MAVQESVEFDYVSLQPSQQHRVHALKAAREVLRAGGPFANSNLGKFDVTDLVDVAEYVISGAHPLDRYSDKEQQP